MKDEGKPDPAYADLEKLRPDSAYADPVLYPQKKQAPWKPGPPKTRYYDGFDGSRHPGAPDPVNPEVRDRNRQRGQSR